MNGHTFKVNHKKLRKLMKKSLSTGMSIYVSGACGIGKSQAVMSAAIDKSLSMGKTFKEWNRLSSDEKALFVADTEESKKIREDSYVFMDIRISQMDPTDIKGLPKINTNFSSWICPQFVRAMSYVESNGLLFFDELNLAPQSVQGACYQIILDRCVGEVALSKGTRVFAAGNRLNDKASIYERSAPLKDRFRNVELDPPSASSWIDEFATKKGIDNRIISFLSWKPEAIFQDYTKSNLGDNFCTPRSWEKVSRDIEGENVMGDVFDYTASIIGSGIAQEFIAFLKYSQEIDLDDVFKNPHKIKEFDAGTKYSVIGAIAGKYEREGNAIIKNIAEIIGTGKDGSCYMNADFAVVLIKMCKAKNSRFISSFLKIPEATKTIISYKKFLVE